MWQTRKLSSFMRMNISYESSTGLGKPNLRRIATRVFWAELLLCGKGFLQFFPCRKHF